MLKPRAPFSAWRAVAWRVWVRDGECGWWWFGRRHPPAAVVVSRALARNSCDSSCIFDIR